MKSTVILPLLLGLAAAGCVTFRVIDDGIDRARIGQAVTRSGLTVMPLGVLEDSRCPKGVACIQAGTVRIAAEIGGNRTELTLDRPAVVARHTVTLVEAYPARLKDIAFFPDEYRFGFRIAE